MATRRKPKKPLTPLQENRLLKIVLGLVVLGFLWVLFAPGFGVVSLFSMRHKAAELRLEIDALATSNEELRLEIERLQNDRAYLERIAREEHGMLKENERVFDFSGKK
jgi:cell division protein FtsB